MILFPKINTNQFLLTLFNEINERINDPVVIEVESGPIIQEKINE